MKHPSSVIRGRARGGCGMGVLRCIGGCVPLFLLAVLLDVLGLTLIFIGIFANLRLDGLFYGDFLIYTGALVVFLSLACWLMWYVGNVPVRGGGEDEGERLEKGGGLARLARKLSERLSRRLQGEEGARGASCARDARDEERDAPPRKASRVTWGRSTAYINQGYDQSADEDCKKESGGRGGAS